MSDPGPINPAQFEGFANSGGTPFGSVFMSTGSGGGFWLFLQEIVDMIDGIDGGAPTDEFAFGFDGGGANSSYSTGIDGGGA